MRASFLTICGLPIQTANEHFTTRNMLAIYKLQSEASPGQNPQSVACACSMVIKIGIPVLLTLLLYPRPISTTRASKTSIIKHFSRSKI
jgi:hypothetical protein